MEAIRVTREWTVVPNQADQGDTWCVQDESLIPWAICFMKQDADGVASALTKACAPVFKAAPDLLASLQQQIICVGNLAKKQGYSPEDIADMTAQARTAISKATGEA